MNAWTEADTQLFAEQKEQLLEILARIGLSSEFEFELPASLEGTPLEELFVAARLAADNLNLIARERDEKIELLLQKEQLIKEQANVLTELSTPVIKVQDEILVLPVIGTIDTIRASQLLEQLLERVAAEGATAVIIDITGVPVVDTLVANHLLRAIESARLLGAECLLTGVRPEVAQAMVRLGVEIQGVVAKSSLQAGLEHALALTGRTIAPLVD